MRNANIYGDPGARIVMGPVDNEDSVFLVQKSDGSFWNYYGSPVHGWFGGNPAQVEVK